MLAPSRSASLSWGGMWGVLIHIHRYLQEKPCAGKFGMVSIPMEQTFRAEQQFCAGKTESVFFEEISKKP